MLIRRGRCAVQDCRGVKSDLEKTYLEKKERYVDCLSNQCGGTEHNVRWERLRQSVQVSPGGKNMKNKS